MISAASVLSGRMGSELNGMKVTVLYKKPLLQDMFESIKLATKHELHQSDTCCNGIGLHINLENRHKLTFVYKYFDRQVFCTPCEN